METVLTQAEGGFVSSWTQVTCENHWTIVFKYGGEQVTATKHRGYDLIWLQGDLAVPRNQPSVVLGFKPQPLCPSMSDVAYKICATEYPATKDLDCAQFVYNFIMTYVKQRHIQGPVDAMMKHLYECC